jgi:predicted DNA-binding ribbon-helix-helix protein
MSTIRKRSVVIGGRKTSVSLEDQFWDALWEIAGNENEAISSVIGRIANRERQDTNLSSAIRLYVLDYYRFASHTGRHKDANKQE